MALTAETIVAKASDAAFGSPLVVNNLRGLLVEAMVSAVVPSEWKWCSGDWAGFDFVHRDGTRLEVKQTAEKQSWESSSEKKRRSFDIARRKERWEGAKRIREIGRFAQLYLFAYHPVIDKTADHRVPEQWKFYIVPTVELPDQKTIARSVISQRFTPFDIDTVAAAIETQRIKLMRV